MCRTSTDAPAVRRTTFILRCCDRFTDYYALKQSDAESEKGLTAVCAANDDHNPIW